MRTAANARYFVRDLAERLANRAQLTTGGFRPYNVAVEDAFGANVDYAMLVKVYTAARHADTRCSPGETADVRTIPITVIRIPVSFPHHILNGRI
jgi:hypothetical protein